jgi:hypothetical protein
VLIWVIGLVGGLVAGGLLMAQVALLVKLVVALGVLILAFFERLGVLLLAGALVGIGGLSFVVLLVTGDPEEAAAGAALAAVVTAAGIGLTLARTLANRSNRANRTIPK